MNDKYARVLYTHTYECLVYSSIGRLANSRSTSVEASEEGFIVSVFHDLWAVSREKLWQIYRPDKMLIDPSIKHHGIISAIFEIEMYSEKFSYDIIHPTFYLFITKFPLYSNLERGLHELKIVTRGPGQTFSSRLSRVTNRPRVLLTLPATIVHLIVLRRWRHGQLTSPEATPRANGLYGDVRYSWTETTVSDARSKWNDQRNRERETTLTARLDAGKSPLFFLEPRRLSLEERRGEASH